MGRIWLCGLLAAALWWLSLHARFQPEPLGADASAIQFSAARADAALGRLLGPQTPHPAGSPENDAVRTRLLAEFAALRIPAQVRPGFSCHSVRQWGAVMCGAVRNVVASVSPGTGRQVLLMAHLDSVPAGPGAADDGSGVATILETIRALKARGATGANPVSVLITDGEEAGLLGAAAFFADPQARAGVGAVVNLEARGNSGPSYLFQTSSGNAALIGLYASSVPHYAASSLYQEVYKYLPNDTDLTPALAAGIPGLNFAFIGDAAQYHTPRDRREAISAATWQSHGENALEMADALSHADLDRLKGADELYLDIMGRWLPRLKAAWALPLSLAALALTALAGFMTRRERREIRRPYTAFLMPPLLLLLAVGLGFGLHGLAAWVSGNADPSFAYPIWMRLSLAFGAFAAALLTAGGGGAIASWLWFCGLAVAASLWAPGIAPHFLLPAIVAAPLLLASCRGGRGVAVVLAVLPALLVWIGLTAGGEQIMGLKLHPLFMVSSGFAMVVLLPVLAKASGRALAISFGLSLAAAAALAVVAGLQPAFSAAAPERLNIRYIESGGRAWWVADPVTRLPGSLRAAAAFSARPEQAVVFGYAAPAGKPHLPVPQAHVVRDGGRITVDVETQGDGFRLMVPEAAKMTALAVNGVAVTPPSGTDIAITCADCRRARLTLDLDSSQAMPLRLEAMWRGLPKDGANLLKARPDWAVPSQFGDLSIVARDVEMPAR
jgi:hypothetical protein